MTANGSLCEFELFMLSDRSGNEIMFAREEELVWLHSELARGHGCRAFSDPGEIIDRTVAVNHGQGRVEIVSALDGKVTCISLGKSTALLAAPRIRQFMQATGHSAKFTLMENTCDLFFALRYLKDNDPCSLPTGSCKLLAKALGMREKVKRKEKPCNGPQWLNVLEPVRQLMRFLHHDVDYFLIASVYEQLSVVLFSSATITVLQPNHLIV